MSVWLNYSLEFTGKTVTYTLDEGVYKSYAGHGSWALFAIDQGVLREYDASWLQTVNAQPRIP